MRRTTHWSAIGILVALPCGFDGSAESLHAQDEKTPPGTVTFTTRDDHQNMLDQLRITKLRPGYRLPPRPLLTK
jgi:hypothetical protein